MGVVTLRLRGIFFGRGRSPMPFGFDGSGYGVIHLGTMTRIIWSPMPFGFDGSGYPHFPMGTIPSQPRSLQCFSALMGVVTKGRSQRMAFPLHGSPMPFGFDGSGYTN